MTIQFTRRSIIAAGAGSAAMLASPHMLAQASWQPEKPIKIILGYASGGATDATARIIGKSLGERLKQPLVVEYKPGAGASIGAETVSKSVADGYTIGLTDSGPLSIMPHLRKVSYDPLTDFTPLSYVCTTGLVVLVHPSVPANNMKELVALAKQRPGSYNYASSGVGSVHHLAGELFKARTGASLVHIPYRGAGPALTDLVGGQVPVMFATIGPAIPMIESGKAKAIGVTSGRRSTALPNVPTLAEQGLKDYEAVLRFVMVAPPKMSSPIASRLQSELALVINEPAVIRELQKLGNDEISPRTAAEVNALLRNDLRLWGEVIRSAKITLDT